MLLEVPAFEIVVFGDLLAGGMWSGALNSGSSKVG